MRPKRFMQIAFLGLLSIQNGRSICNNAYMHNVSIFKVQINHHNTINVLPDNSVNNIHPLSYVASHANNNVLYYHQVMQSDNSDAFRKAIDKEISSFKEENIFEIIPIEFKPKEKSLIPFI